MTHVEHGVVAHFEMAQCVLLRAGDGGRALKDERVCRVGACREEARDGDDSRRETHAHLNGDGVGVGVGGARL